MAYLSASSSEGLSFKIFEALALNTGARLGEILAITKSDINLELQRISINKIYDPEELKTVPRTKGKKIGFLELALH